jgi:hypothetical protein
LFLLLFIWFECRILACDFNFCFSFFE